MQNIGFWAEFGDSWTAMVIRDAAMWALIVAVGTAFGSWIAIVLLENMPGFVKDMKAWLARSKKLNGSGLA